MTFNPNVPNASQSPGLFPAQMNTDLARLKAIINADHVFNDTAQINDGIHKQVSLLNQAFPTTLVNGQSGTQFVSPNAIAQSQGWYFNGAANLPLTSTKAFVSFDGTTTIPTIRAGFYNVASVTRWLSSPGRYRITFQVPFVALASGTSYVTQLSAMASSDHVLVNLRTNTTVAASQTSTYVDIETCARSTGNFVDCQYVGVTIHTIL